MIFAVVSITCLQWVLTRALQDIVATSLSDNLLAYGWSTGNDNKQLMSLLVLLYQKDIFSLFNLKYLSGDSFLVYYIIILHTIHAFEALKTTMMVLPSQTIIRYLIQKEIANLIEDLVSLYIVINYKKASSIGKSLNRNLLRVLVQEDSLRRTAPTKAKIRLLQQYLRALRQALVVLHVPVAIAFVLVLVVP
ncbi:hypothetical protein EPI10_032467 [Gossypium australe]|uniref:Uncharacterized protein n=1 Tax=Gossypium australe TaxID=47621 RepID=A0A5B6X6Y0_9ROSI|nr:hypothetical protein EPI10_032467 [Gossypium australe]